MEIDSAGAVGRDGYFKIEIGAAAGYIESNMGHGKGAAVIDYDLHVEMREDHAAGITQTPGAGIGTAAGWRL